MDGAYSLGRHPSGGSQSPVWMGTVIEPLTLAGCTQSAPVNVDGIKGPF